jgi:hypothetical protein
METLAVFRDISLLWLIFLTLIAILPFAVVFFFAIKGMHRLRQLAKQYLPLAQEKAAQVAAVTEQVSQKVAKPFIEAQAKQAEMGGIVSAISRRKQA